MKEIRDQKLAKNIHSELVHQFLANMPHWALALNPLFALLLVYLQHPHVQQAHALAWVVCVTLIALVNGWMY
jgi:hypothetical protein